MPPLSTHFRFTTLAIPSLRIASNTGCFILGTVAPDAFAPDSAASFSQYHFNRGNGQIDLPSFVKTTSFVPQPVDNPVWAFTCGYFCHLWLDVFYRTHADSISITRPAGMPDADLRSLVRRETEILNASFVLEIADLSIPRSADFLLPEGLRFVDYERCVSLFNEVIKQSREWSVFTCEFKSIDQAGYAAFLENSSHLFLNKFQVAT